MKLSVERAVSLRELTSFGVDARAAFFARLGSAEQLAEVLADPHYLGLPRLILGGGSNLLFTRDFDGLVLKIEIPGLREVGETAESWLVEASAGENWHGVVVRLLDLDRPGLENLALIPGAIGAAPIQNIGAYGVELAERLHSVVTWDIAEQRMIRMSLTECGFGYRDSAFKSEIAGQRVVLGVTFALPKRWEPVTGYVDVANELKAHGIKAPGPRHVFEAVVAIRRRKLPDPTAIGNAGSFFKNPIVSRVKHNELLAHFPSLVSYPLSGGRFKLAAGWLIDAVGLKGATRGRAGIYDKQALVLVNRGGATGVEILALAREVQDKVQEKFGVTLAPEPMIL